MSGNGRRKGKERTRLSAECGAPQLRVQGLGLLNHPGAPQIRFLSKEKRGLRCCRKGQQILCHITLPVEHLLMEDSDLKSFHFGYILFFT